MTWSLWQVRADVPHLPLWDGLPQFSFGWLMLGSLAVTLALPRGGSSLHAALLVAACAFDQLRSQPQFFCIAILLFTATHHEFTWLGRWFLATMWLWAGLHKFLSPDWHGEQAWLLSAQLGLAPERYYRALAVLVASFEIVLGLLAIGRPRWATWLCVALHLGIAVVLSPVLADWNATVIPWNLATASVGSWLLWQVRTPWPASSRQAAVATCLFALPGKSVV